MLRHREQVRSGFNSRATAYRSWNSLLVETPSRWRRCLASGDRRRNSFSCLPFHSWLTVGAARRVIEKGCTASRANPPAPSPLGSNVKPMIRATLLIGIIVFATAALAHKDRILSVRMDGTIPELPPDYQTTRLHIAFSEGGAGALQQLDFLSSGRKTSVQPCLLRLVPKGSFHQLFLAGSWYHDESIAPHYLDVQLIRACISCSAFATPGSSKSPMSFHCLRRTPANFGTYPCLMAVPRKSALAAASPLMAHKSNR
jgi:hypothetical protein